MLASLTVNALQIAAYLEEHEPYFVKSLSDLRAVFDNISLMDSSFGSWEVRMNNASSEYEAEVCFYDVFAKEATSLLHLDYFD